MAKISPIISAKIVLNGQPSTLPVRKKTPPFPQITPPSASYRTIPDDAAISRPKCHPPQATAHAQTQAAAACLRPTSVAGRCPLSPIPIVAVVVLRDALPVMRPLLLVFFPSYSNVYCSMTSSRQHRRRRYYGHHP
jgi:hypothetical protein